MPQLDPTWFASQLFWLAITFLVLHLILSRVVLPPLQGVLARREETQAQDIETAQNLKIQAEEAQAAYERVSAQSRAKAQEVLAAAQEESKKKADEASRALDKQVEQKLAEATRNITAKKAELIAGLTPASSELASLIVGRLTESNAKG